MEGIKKERTCPSPVWRDRDKEISPKVQYRGTYKPGGVESKREVRSK